MKKKTTIELLLLLMLATPIVGRAQTETQQQLVVWLTSGEKVYFNLDEEPRTTFDNGQLVITTSRTTAYYQLTGVMRYTYEGAMTNIPAPPLKPGEMVYMQSNNEMAFDGLPDGTTLDLYSSDGRKLRSERATQDQRTVVSLADLPTGTYILKCGNATYKFVKR
jgi:hypothetical protein